MDKLVGITVTGVAYAGIYRISECEYKLLCEVPNKDFIFSRMYASYKDAGLHFISLCRILTMGCDDE